MGHSREQLLDFLAPCSLLCYSCPAFVRGIVSDLSRELANYFEGFYDFLAKNLPEHLKAKAEEIKSFEEKLRDYARPGCNGCRNNRNPGCSVKGCFISDCTKEHGIDYCGECDAFPCRKVETLFPDPSVYRRWLRGSTRIQQVGAAQFFEEEKVKSHYADLAKNAPLIKRETMENCIICRIIRGEVPSYKVYEDEHVLGILDKMQATYGHTMVFCKAHHADLFSIPEAELMRVIKGVKLAAEVLRKRLGCTGVNLLSASGKSAQQSVFHLHFHIIPRWEGDGVDAWPQFDYRNPDKEEIFRRISGALNSPEN